MFWRENIEYDHEKAVQELDRIMAMTSTERSRKHRERQRALHNEKFETATKTLDSRHYINDSLLVQRKKDFNVDYGRLARSARLDEVTGSIVEKRQFEHATPHLAAIRRYKFLVRLRSFVQERLPHDVARWEAEAAIDAALQAGSRAATPRQFTQLIDDLEEWRKSLV